MGYDFAQLSSLDFEELVRDLLQEETGKLYEIFKPGRDGGIDLRHFQQNEHSIVQCKHFLKSGVKKLISVLKNEEYPKIKHINPVRYIVATSVPLSPQDKATIKSALSPYIKAEADIIGQEDINNLLNRYPKIEKNHFKLWLGSKAVLDRILHNAVLTQSEQLIQKIQGVLPLFVENKSFGDAINILNENRCVIISGEPGVGKTTLADMLLLNYSEKGYMPIDVREPKDAYDIYSPEQKIIYYYDDFLGLTHLGDRHSQEATGYVVKLINLVRKSKNARMILTSREFVIKQARQHNERFANSDFLEARYILRLSAYTKLLRARILYNHLYFSDLSDAYLDAIIASDTHKKIINHKNYSPRLMEWMTKSSMLQDVSPEDYPVQFMHILDAPLRLWEHPYRQISCTAQHLLLTLFSLGSDVSSDRLRLAYTQIHGFLCKKYNLVYSPQDFNDALSEILGSFLKIERTHILYFNPSIKDFLEVLVLNNSELCADILESAIYLEQLSNVWNLLEAHGLSYSQTQKVACEIIRLKSSLVHIKKHDNGNVAYYFNDLSLTQRCSFYAKVLRTSSDVEIMKILNETLDAVLLEEEAMKDDISDWAKLAKEFAPLVQNRELPSAVLDKISNIIRDDKYGIPSLGCFVEVIEAIDESALPSSLLQTTQNNFQEYLRKGATSECMEARSSAELKENLKLLSSVAERLVCDVSDLTKTIEERIAEAEAYEEARADQDYDEYKDRVASERYEEQAIDSMFNGLKDR